MKNEATMNNDWSKKLRSNFVDGKTIFIHGNFGEDIPSFILPEFDKLIEKEKDKKEGKIIIDIDSKLKL